MTSALPRILIIGKNGQVGWELYRTLTPIGLVEAVDYPEIDLADADAIRTCLREHRPDLVVNAAAYTQVDKAESEYDNAMAINGTAPGIMAEEARRLGALMVHFSTDYVFDGRKTEPYVETDSPNPLGAYGKTKLAGDQAVRASGVDHQIFRLCWVYGARGQNFMLTMVRLARDREVLKVVSDQVGCPTWSRMIAETTAQAAKQMLASRDRTSLCGTFHLAASGHTSWHGFASEIVRLMSPDDKKCSAVEPISTAQYPTPARRPAYSVLDCNKLERTFQLRLPEWSESLRHVFEK